ncbi:MAG: cysteine-rich CWC family protein [Candidatus Marinarcus sp.]|uniref:cysteine-rich CWC family protein n=1 Tax=Candidatus Marinarcus sp. TaxID=3100987 RepID=UPI003AFFCE44
MNEIIDKNLCPFCGKENNCMANKAEDCWCNHVEVPLSLRELIPEHKRMKACICKMCIELFQNDSKNFIQKYNKA